MNVSALIRKVVTRGVHPDEVVTDFYAVVSPEDIKQHGIKTENEGLVKVFAVKKTFIDQLHQCGFSGTPVELELDDRWGIFQKHFTEDPLTCRYFADTESPNSKVSANQIWEIHQGKEGIVFVESITRTTNSLTGNVCALFLRGGELYRCNIDEADFLSQPNLGVYPRLLQGEEEAEVRARFAQAQSEVVVHRSISMAEHYDRSLAAQTSGREAKADPSLMDRASEKAKEIFGDGETSNPG